MPKDKKEAEYGERIPCGKYVYRVVKIPYDHYKVFTVHGRLLSEDVCNQFLTQSPGWRHIGYGENNFFMVFKRDAEPGQEKEIHPPEKLEPATQISTDRIYNTMLEYERKYHVFPEFPRTEINFKMRRIFIDWLYEIEQPLRISAKGTSLAIHLLDRLLVSSTPIPRKELQLYGSVCLLLASKFQEIIGIEEADMVYYCDDAYTKEQFETTQDKVVQLLGFSCFCPTVHHFIENRKEKLGLKDTTLENFLGKVAIQEGLEKPYLPSTIADACISLATGISTNTGSCQRNIIKACKDILSRETCKGVLESYASFNIKMLRICDPETPNSKTVSVLPETPRIEDSKDYTLQSLLGHGSFGKVYTLSDSKEPEKKYALKEFQDNLNYATIRELTFLSELDHPNIIKAKNFSLKEGKFVYKMDLLRTLDISELSISDVKHYSRQLLRAVAYLHSRNVIHRDIKPQNILLDKAQNLYLADLGSGCICTTSAPFRHETEVCTIWYRPPECGIGVYNTSFDLWSVGCTIAGMVLGRPLFRVDNLTELWYSIARLGDAEDLEREGIQGFIAKNPIFSVNSLKRVLRRRSGEWSKNKEEFESVCSLLQRMLAPNCLYRWTAEEALKHPFVN